MLIAWALPPLVVLLFVWQGLGGTARDFHLPVDFVGDTLFYLAQSKATLDHGWWWWNPSIGLPTGYHALAFAQNTNVDQAIVRLVGTFTTEVGFAVNVAWMVMLALSATTARWGLRRLGVSHSGATVGAVLFATTPFAFYRNISHFNLVTYLVPFPATAALLLASSAGHERVRAVTGLGGILIGCLLLGLNYIYYAFFGCILIGAAAVVGFGRTRSRSVLRAGGLCIGVIVLATALNLLPNVLVWRDVGHPRGVAHNASESETYALKIRTLVSPVWTFHWFPPFRTWLEREGQAMFPVETESMHARLGIVATVGLVALLATLVWPGPRQADDAIESSPDDSARLGAPANLIPAAARLTLVAILVATLGGFGSLFSLLVSPEIRSYNRIAPFIAFFVLAGGAAWLDQLCRRAPRHARHAAWVLILGIGLADQGVALYEVKREQPRMEPGYRRVAAFVSELETRLPPNAAVFQLPLRPFPVDGGIGKLWAYDQFRPYLLSHHLRWSYPSLTQRQYEWEESVASLPATDLPRRLARDGFTAILISRAGYDDGGAAIAQALREAPDGPSLIAESQDFVALQLTRSAVAP